MNKFFIIGIIFFTSCLNKPNIKNREIEPNEIKSIKKNEKLGQIEDVGPQYSPNGKFTPGIFTDSGYVNSYFGFQIIVGPDWEILDRLEQKRMLDVTKSELTEKNAKFEQDFDVSESNWFEILTLRQNDWVPWINFMGEKLEPIPGVSNPMEYLEYCKFYIITSDPDKNSFPIYKDGRISKDSISGREFLAQYFTIENENGKYYQTTYSAQFGEYLLNIITNYENDEQEKLIQNFLNTVIWLN